MVEYYLENMEPFVLNHFAIVAKQVHAYFQMVSTVNILSHDVVVDPIQQELSKELDRLALCDIRAGIDQNAIVALEEEIKVCAQVMAGDGVLLCKYFLSFVSKCLGTACLRACAHSESCKCVCTNFKSASIDPIEEAPEDSFSRLHNIQVNLSRLYRCLTFL